ncbi:hypothetical protein HanPSC8_Chr08g0310301 [Helianthus annuus]|nr:hypothetical protein HanPSC8_Chr08g0310301 [Helianthus annuus]
MCRVWATSSSGPASLWPTATTATCPSPPSTPSAAATPCRVPRLLQPAATTATFLQQRPLL